MNDQNPLPQRRSPRLKDYDYAQQGAYFVTICTFQREYLFGDVVDSEMQLSAYGKIAQSCLQAIPDHFPQVDLDAWVTMPNHVHAIILIWELVGTQHAVSASTPPHTPEQFAKPVSGSLSTIVRSYKSAVTKQINLISKYPVTVWQSRFHDHIIRNENALNYIRRYVQNNPAKWAEDTFYSPNPNPP